MRPSRSSSVSSVSSAASSPSEDTHHIFVKLLSGETIPLTIPSSTPVDHLQHLLSLRTSAPASSIRLIHAGRHLNASTSTISLPPPSSSSSTSNTTSSHLPKSPSSTTTPSSLPSSPASIRPTLSTLSIPQNAILHITLPILGGMPPPKKIKCTFKDCKAASQRIVGDCSFCQGHFCGNHRMLEDHKCTGLEDCKAEAHERNKEVLEGQKTVALRGI